MAGLGLNPRTGQPEEIASAALSWPVTIPVLLTDLSLVVDGGWTAY